MLPGWFAAADPPGPKLGSGGGTAHLLHAAWQAQGSEKKFEDWIDTVRPLVLHGGGESRRLPAYAPVGKPLIPLPPTFGQPGQRLDRMLIDEQGELLDRLFAHAPAASRVMIASGDVILRYGSPLPPFPEMDVIAIGMHSTVERAVTFGVFFTPADEPGTVSFFLQKPSATTIRGHAAHYRFLLDTGVWLLSRRAVEVLMRKCSWDAEVRTFAGNTPSPYEFYAAFGPALGTAPAAPDPEVSGLSCAVIELPDPLFLHFGTSRQLIESAAALTGVSARDSDRFVVNARCAAPLDDVSTLWIEGSDIPADWRLAGDHVLTGIPDNDWELHLPRGACLDIVPLGGNGVCLRHYNLDDTFSGTAGDAGTMWMGAPASAWLVRRGIDCADAGIDPDGDIIDAPLFPASAPDDLFGPFVAWLLAHDPDDIPGYREQWLGMRRLSARELRQSFDATQYLEGRHEATRLFLAGWYAADPAGAVNTLDLEAAARLFEHAPGVVPAARPDPTHDPLAAAGDAMFRAAVHRRHGESGDEEETRAFALLRSGILAALGNKRSAPALDVLPDQIVWARSPARLDLAGGWTDTPPYCLRFGGRVVNAAVNLNGQPPIQVFLRRSDDRAVIIRSIDLGVTERVTTFEELDTFARPGSGFAVAKAGLALAGFLPRFHAGGGEPTLERQLAAFGGGIELTMLAAVPQGSGLGTSSILAATVLGALSRFCSLGWNADRIMAATMALEQLLTTGGGWQDQAGGLLRGLKLVESAPGLNQRLTARWLPDFLFRDADITPRLLLYYTGITRLAKNILQEIVRRMFLGAADQLSLLRDIGANVAFTAGALQENNLARVTEGIARSWDLNRRLDPGTCPPSVAAVIDPIAKYTDALKLLGAGGGGYLFIIARDADAAVRIRRTLAEHPPNGRARFVEPSLSDTGMEVTVS